MNKRFQQMSGLLVIMLVVCAVGAMGAGYGTRRLQKLCKNYTAPQTDTELVAASSAGHYVIETLVASTSAACNIYIQDYDATTTTTTGLFGPIYLPANGTYTQTGLSITTGKTNSITFDQTGTANTCVYLEYYNEGV